MAVTIDPAAHDLWVQMKAGTTETAWFILSIDAEDKKRLNLSTTGRCGLEHLRRFLQDDQVGWRCGRFVKPQLTNMSGDDCATCARRAPLGACRVRL